MSIEVKSIKCGNCFAVLSLPEKPEGIKIVVTCEYCTIDNIVGVWGEYAEKVLLLLDLNASLKGSGAIAQGNNTVAVGAGGVLVGKSVGGSVVTGNVKVGGKFYDTDS